MCIRVAVLRAAVHVIVILLLVNFYTIQYQQRIEEINNQTIK